MPSLLLLLLVAASSILALTNWRLGLMLCIVVGVLQDPVRKVTAGTPAYLTLAFLPIYLATLAKLWHSTDLVQAMRHYYPQLLTVAAVFAVALLASTVQTLSYGVNAMPLALLGLFSYAGGIPALFLGFFCLRRDFKELDRPLMFLAAITGLMLVGVPLEHFGYQFSQPWLGTVGADRIWHRWYSSSEWIEMISGFYRSPEIMGWHAATLTVICVYLMVRRPGGLLLWAAGAGWGLSCVLLSGRRKMLLMVIAFVATFILTSGAWRRSKLMLGLMLTFLVLIPILNLMVDDRYLETARSSFPAAGSRLHGHAVSGPLWLLTVVGLFGYGVGTKTQGAQHLLSSSLAPSTEGGLEKILVELGLVGAFAFLVLVVVLAGYVYRGFRWVREARVDRVGPAALAAFLLANFAGFVVAFQVYGDPMVVFLLGLAAGMVLSTPRLVDAQTAREVGCAPNP